MPRWPVLLTILACACRTSGPAEGPTARAASAPPPSPGSPAPPDVPPSPGDPCADDGECVATNFPGCCACPQCSQGEPHARSVEGARRAEAACAAASCDAAICAIAGMCPPGEPASNFAARCRQGVCVLERLLGTGPQGRSPSGE